VHFETLGFEMPSDLVEYEGDCVDAIEHFQRLPASISASSAPDTMVSQLTPEAIRAQLARLGDHAFTGSVKLFAFLSFVVAEELEGRGRTLKELVIGDSLYGGIQPYDPRIDSTVRVEARRLRKKLEAYYGTNGAHDAIRITIPCGGYAPRFTVNANHQFMSGSKPASISRPLEPSGIAVLYFTALSLDDDEIAFADGLSDEVILAASRLLAMPVAPRSLVIQYRKSRFSLADVATETGSSFILHGTVRRCSDMRRITLELSDHHGRVLWSDRIDVSGAYDILDQEQAAAAVIQMLPDTIGNFGMPTKHCCGDRLVN